MADSTRCRPEEFEFVEGGIKHRPTGYVFNRHPDNPHSGTVVLGKVDEVLPDGRKYDRVEVEKMAMELWVRHWNL